MKITVSRLLCAVRVYSSSGSFKSLITDWSRFQVGKVYLTNVTYVTTPEDVSCSYDNIHRINNLYISSFS